MTSRLLFVAEAAVTVLLGIVLAELLLALAEAAVVVLLGIVLAEALLALAEAAVVVLLGIVLAEALLALAEATDVLILVSGHETAPFAAERPRILGDFNDDMAMGGPRAPCAAPRRLRASTHRSRPRSAARLTPCEAVRVCRTAAARGRERAGVVQDGVGKGDDGRLDLDGESDAGVEAATFDGMDDDARRAAGQRARELDRVVERRSRGSRRSRAVPRGNGVSVTSTLRIVPAGAPERIVSTITTASAPSQRTRRSIGSPCSSRTSTPSGSVPRASRRATATPAPSSERSSLPTPITSTRGQRSVTLDGQLEEVRRAGDARIVVADRLLAAQRQLVVGQIDVALDDGTQVLLDRALVLRGRRDDPRVDDRAVVVDLIAVVQQAARRLGRAVADGPPRDDLDRRARPARS